MALERKSISNATITGIVIFLPLIGAVLLSFTELSGFNSKDFSRGPYCPKTEPTGGKGQGIA